jgi:uncharacterized protein YwgA
VNMMQPRDLVLAVIDECGERREFGRTSLQKVTYLASLVFDVDLGHDAYYYGPYSAEVESDAEALVLAGLVAETVHTFGTNSRGFPVNRRHYATTDAGRERVARVAMSYPEQMEKLRGFIKKIVDVVGSLDQQTLSTAAKTLYLARAQDKPVSPEEVKSLAKELGWKLSTSRINQVAQMLSQLNLVRVVDA